MKEKSTKKKKSGGGSGGGAQQFLVWHGEKIAVGLVVVVALWFAVQGLGYQKLSWPSDALEKESAAAEAAIKESTRTAKDEGIEFFDHAKFADQIKAPISVAPYRGTAVWNSAMFTSSSPLGAQSTSQEY